MRPSLKLVFVAVPFALGWLAPGCGLQGEGQLCSTLTNAGGTSSDCDQSVRALECVSKGGLGTNLGICCPATSGVTSTAPECQPGWHAYTDDGGIATTGSAGGGSSSASSSASGSTSSSASGSTSSSASGSTSSSASSSASGSTSSSSSGAGGGSSSATSSSSSMSAGGM